MGTPNSEFDFNILFKWSFFEFMERKLPHWYGHKVKGISKKKINYAIFNAIFFGKFSPPIYLHRLRTEENNQYQVTLKF